MQGFIDYSHSVWRNVAEFTITGDQRGIGRLGGEFWSVVKDRKGQRRGTVTERFPESSWRNLDPWAPLLAPGADGAVATTRFEMLREGAQDCEARIFIERALTDAPSREKLGDDLARRCREALAERLRAMWRASSSLLLTQTRSGDGGPQSLSIAGHTWFVGSLWQERNRKLYSLAAEVARKVEAR